MTTISINFEFEIFFLRVCDKEHLDFEPVT